MPSPRRSVILSLPPLWLIGVCLFLPAVRACERMESPASLLWGGTPFFAGLLAPYLVAQLVAVLGIVALARGRVTPLVTRATAALVVLSGASALLLAVVGGINGHDAAGRAWSVFAGAASVAGGVVLLRARALDPWPRLARFYAAYAILTLPLASLLARILVEDGVHKVGVGAYLFLAAVAALVAVHARALAPPRDPVSSSTA